MDDLLLLLMGISGFMGVLLFAYAITRILRRIFR